MFIILIAVYQFLENLGLPGAIAWAIVVPDPDRPGGPHPAVPQAARLPAPDAAHPARAQGDPEALQGRLGEGAAWPSRSCSRSAASTRWPAACRCCCSCPSCSSCTRSSSNGLTNVDPTAMLTVFGVQVVDLQCTNINPATGMPDAALGPCIDAIVPILGDIAAARRPSCWIAGFGLSFLAIISALLQLVQSRMMLPVADPTNDDPNTRIQRQTMLFLPLISVVYGGFLPAGLFIYWIVATIFSIVQQYLIVGWGAMFPLFGWTPRSPSTTPRASRWPCHHHPTPASVRPILTDADKKTTADKTIRRTRAGPPGPTRETTLT